MHELSRTVDRCGHLSGMQRHFADEGLANRLQMRAGKTEDDPLRLISPTTAALVGERPRVRLAAYRLQAGPAIIGNQDEWKGIGRQSLAVVADARATPNCCRAI